MKTYKKQVNSTSPAKISSREFLSTNGYELAKKGGCNYLREFNIVKKKLASMARYDSLPELLNAAEGDSVLCNTLAKNLIKLWQDNCELRPASGAILLFILWKQLAGVKCSDFGKLCANVFLHLKEINYNDEPDVIKAIINTII